MHGWKSPVMEQLNYATADLTKKPDLRGEVEIHPMSSSFVLENLI